jgi:DNA-binding response OmpR family regulator
VVTWRAKANDDITELGEIVMTDHGNNGSTRFPTPGHGAGPTRASCVLLAEDDEEMRALLAMTLRKFGYQVIECTDGLQLMKHLALLLEARACSPIDLIVSDVRLPWADGMELLGCTSDYAERPPFVLITAFPSEAVRAEAVRLGAAFMLSKPFDMNYFLEMVRTVIPPQGRWPP